MRKILCIIIIFLITGFNAIAKGDNMEDLDKIREEHFKAKIGFDKAKSAPNSQGVVADWSSIQDWKMLKEYSWDTTGFNTYTEDTEVVYKQAFNRGNEKIGLIIIVSSYSNQAAMEYLLRLALSSSMFEPPYNKAAGMGDFFINYLDPNRKTFMWVYRNIYFQLRHSNIIESKSKPFDSFAFARGIQEYAEKHLVNNMQAYYPKISRVDISQPKINVGDTFSITAVADDRTTAGNLNINAKSNSKEVLSFKKKEGATYLYEAIKSGSAQINFTLIDQKTLLMTKKTVTINVLEKGKE